MRKFMLLLMVLWLTTEKAPATEAQASVGLNTADAAKAWEAVGRVNLVGTGFCTGALIAPNLVLTAAHCMFDKRTGERVKTENVEFLAGWRDGRAAAIRRAKRVVIHEDYKYKNTRRLDRVAADIALIELDSPIRNSRIEPFAWAKRPRVGQTVQVVSYSKEHAQTPALQEACEVLGRDPSVLVLSCQVTYGASGSPIFVLENGIPRIASVISAKAEWQDRNVSLGASLGRPLEQLISRLNKYDGVFRKVESLSAGGSKFVKP